MISRWIMQTAAIMALLVAVGCTAAPTAAPATEPAPDPTEVVAEEATDTTEEATDTTDEATDTADEATDTTASTESFDDPFAYCAAVGTIDAPDERYTGEEVPESLVAALRRAFNTPDTPLEVYQRGTFWRCMDSKVYACMVGANLPCQEKADLSETPTDAMREFCQEEANANAEFIPMVVTGRATVYSWSCVDGEPQVGEQVSEVDAQGFLSNIWYELSPE